MTLEQRQRISTPRLEMVAATLEHVSAELEGAEQLAQLLNAEIDSGWPPGEYDRGAQEYFRDRLSEGGPDVVGWYGWYAIRRAEAGESAVVVGAGGYFGPPNEVGVVEIGVSIVPNWQGCGYATEIVAALVANAFQDRCIRRVIAHAAPTNLASQRLLVKCGFGFVGNEPESGDDLFEIVREPLA